VPVVDGCAVADAGQDILKMAVIDRHTGSGMVFGFIQGFGLKRGALAGTVAHDHHNLVVIGADDGAMLSAARHVGSLGGGLAVVDGGGETVLADLPDTCPLARAEIYGPVTILYRFATLDAAIQRANHVEYGLQAGVFTNDLQSAFYAAAHLDCGGVMINDSTDYRIDAMPFGGVKGSGLGREGIRFALQEMTEPKVVCFNLAGNKPRYLST